MIEVAITNEELHDIEDRMFRGLYTEQDASKLVSEIVALKHELSHPNYMYAGSRIHRQAIICRNAQIVLLEKHIAELKGP